MVAFSASPVVARIKRYRVLFAVAGVAALAAGAVFFAGAGDLVVLDVFFFIAVIVLSRSLLPRNQRLP